MTTGITKVRNELCQMSWDEAGKMDENKDSAGAMTKNGTITLASALA